MNRSELQRLSNERIEDAQALLAASRWAGAYYLAGYAVECALKACVMAYIERTGIIFEDKKYAEKCSHQRRRYFVSDFFRRPAESAHGDDYSEDRGHNPQSRKSVRHGG